LDEVYANLSDAGIAQSRGARVITTWPNRSLQRNVGALHVQQDVLYFVGSDFYLIPTVLDGYAACELDEWGNFGDAENL